MDCHAKLCWMKDLLEHLEHCYDQWQDADQPTAGYLAATIRRDLTELHRLLGSFDRDQATSEAMAVA